ncbi:MAG: hypothetical protein [Caudoviricetes sp.]|nr:MAG: hypothetical protein [Caudoviricetes sp.]
MSYTFTTNVGDGVSLAFPFSFAGADLGYIAKSNISVFVAGELVSNYTVPSNDPNKVYFTTAPAIGAEVLIRRIMPKNVPYADFSRGNPFSQDTLNDTNLQQLYVVQELLDGFLPDGFYMKQDVNMGGHKLINLGAGTDEGHSINYQQYAALRTRIERLEQGLDPSGELIDDQDISVQQPFTGSATRTQHDKNAEYPTIYDWDSDSLNDDTTRFLKAQASNESHILLLDKELKVSNLTLSKPIYWEGCGGMGLDPVSTRITVDNDADFGIFLNGQLATNRPTGGGLYGFHIGCANRATMGNPDLIKVTSWSHLDMERITAQNSKGWAFRFQDFMESYLTKFTIRAVGSESTGGILLDDYLGSYSGNNVNNLKIHDGTFAGLSGPWVKSTNLSNPDVIWLHDLKAEFDAILAEANTTTKYVIDFGMMANCWIQACRFAYLNDTNNMYNAILHMGAACGNTTIFSSNMLFAARSPWLIEGGSFSASQNFSNQATYPNSSNMGGVITSSKACYAEPVIHVTSNGNVTRGKPAKDPGFIPARDLGGNTNNGMVANPSASESTVMLVAAGSQMRSLAMPANLLDGTAVINLTLRVSCTDLITDGNVAVIAGSTTLATRTVTASKGFQLLRFQIKPSQLTGVTSLSLTNAGTVSVWFDGLKFEKSSYIDWNFAFTPPAIAAGGVAVSPTQSYVDTIGVTGLIQAISQGRFDSPSTGLIASINTMDANGSFTVSLYNPTAATITPSITRCFVRIFLG